MSDPIKHECGIVLLRLLKPMSYYIEKYGSPYYGINKMYLLMQKQHNRGQDGAGFVSVKFDPEPGNNYIFRRRSVENQPLQDIFGKISRKINKKIKENPEYKSDLNLAAEKLPYVGNVYMGHLRYGTYGKNKIANCHPFLRSNNWMHKNLMMAGNFNMTNVDELFETLINLGQHPKEKADTITVLERTGHFLDEEVNKIWFDLKNQGINKKDATPIIMDKLDVGNMLRRSAKKWDGGYTIGGMVGHGDAFVVRDPNGIRPCYYYIDDEIAVVTSERPVIQTAFKVDYDDIKELDPGKAIIMKKNGNISFEQIREPKEKLSCSFERIYFSRGNDKDIYNERLNLGKLISRQVLNSIAGDLDNTVFSFIPNTAEVAFYGLLKGVENYQKRIQIDEIKESNGSLSDEKLEEILEKRVRLEKIAIKDAKLRTFITEDSSRDDLVSHVYDVTYGTVKPTDTLVVLDDSIVRGTTLQKSIIRILDTLNPKKIVVVSSAPQIRYPDCYGIDMAKLGDFIAFRAAIELLKETGKEKVIDEVYAKCKASLELEEYDNINYVKGIYDLFTAEEVSAKVAQMIREENINAEVEVIFQTIDNLHKACPDNLGDWYFSGDYPTASGMRVVNRAFVNYYEGKNVRAY
ncbi:MAG: amidophosphoribosyltransferase [Chlorobiota bacterium]